MSSYKAEFRGTGESTFVSNGIRLPDAEQAEAYARDLFCRWFGADEYRIAEAVEAPNHTADWRGSLTRIEEGKQFKISGMEGTYTLTVMYSEESVYVRSDLDSTVVFLVNKDRLQDVNNVRPDEN